ncbi:protein of unknown function [Taphrina deformans PYCC 5710]|uniref:Chromatin target of PRMT1 protein C-terminal domain-containing protein n=1 Tax=Taphrina deformans (strain PYCC 5710 / ATCC 11124 / CBS 356.35 / IMI 108563 / JCM 9778 / NBRC 8474) TaxID=1097556 RepID=R4XGA6_TAPDE|nr:protein of unknown function [Taphrina deformans PYCC 5710]|eukprot:CCG84662.1 protein of unknown function [Taphrina deformans PYCC 5710]
MRFDRAGRLPYNRSEGIAFVTYDRYGDAKTAIQEYDGQSALGQLLEVELDSVVPPPRNNPNRDLASRISGEPRGRRDEGPRRGGSRGGRGQPRPEKSSTTRRGPVTADDLDAELDNYINQRNNGDSQKVAEAGTGTANTTDSGLDGMQID